MNNTYNYIKTDEINHHEIEILLSFCFVSLLICIQSICISYYDRIQDTRARNARGADE